MIYVYAIYLFLKQGTLHSVAMQYTNAFDRFIKFLNNGVYEYMNKNMEHFFKIDSVCQNNGKSSYTDMWDNTLIFSSLKQFSKHNHRCIITRFITV